ncbi:MAG: hypothetical protein JNJ58_03160 [Chitinophagaceae bacterium]|nr:hypothetical protein [Chitinophagaceae bacterium]
MLGLLLIYFIGKYFYDLAGLYDKNKWGFAILGVLMYYVGTFVTGIFIGIFNADMIEEGNNLVLGLMALPFGILSSYLTYILLKKNWSKNIVSIEDEIQGLGSEVEQPKILNETPIPSNFDSPSSNEFNS